MKAIASALLLHGAAGIYTVTSVQNRGLGAAAVNLLVDTLALSGNCITLQEQFIDTGSADADAVKSDVTRF